MKKIIIAILLIFIIAITMMGCSKYDANTGFTRCYSIMLISGNDKSYYEKDVYFQYDGDLVIIKYGYFDGYYRTIIAPRESVIIYYKV